MRRTQPPSSVHTPICTAYIYIVPVADCSVDDTPSPDGGGRSIERYEHAAQMLNKAQQDQTLEDM